MMATSFELTVNRCPKNFKAVLEASTNSEDRLVRLEAQIMGIQETLQDLGDQLAQVKEAQSLTQDHSQTILERTPIKAAQTHPARGWAGQQRFNCAAATASSATCCTASACTAATHAAASEPEL